jgi:hypothetical protein
MKNIELEASEPFAISFPSLTGEEAAKAAEVVRRRLEVLKQAFSEAQLAALMKAGVLDPGKMVLDDARGTFPELFLGTPESDSLFEEFIRSWRDVERRFAERRVAKIAEAFQIIADIEQLPFAPTIENVVAAKQRIHAFFSSLRRSTWQLAQGQPIDDVDAFAQFAAMLTYMTFLLEDGSPHHWQQFKEMTAALYHVPVTDKRASIVDCVQRHIGWLYSKDASEGEVSSEDLEGQFDELKADLTDVESKFSVIDERLGVTMLRRADPKGPKPLGPSYIAAMLAIHAGAFGDVAESGEPLEAAARRISNIFRNAHNTSRRKP